MLLTGPENISAITECLQGTDDGRWNRRPLARTRWRPTAARTASSVAMTRTRRLARVTAV